MGKNEQESGTDVGITVIGRYLNTSQKRSVMLPNNFFQQQTVDSNKKMAYVNDNKWITMSNRYKALEIDEKYSTNETMHAKLDKTMTENQEGEVTNKYKNNKSNKMTTKKHRRRFQQSDC